MAARQLAHPPPDLAAITSATAVTKFDFATESAVRIRKLTS
jgi:hypothetical protein